MKFYVLLTFLTAVIMVIVPAAALSREKSDQKNKTETTENTSVTENTTQEYIDVFMTQTETILSVDKVEYITGVLAGEMPASYHEEALKAQAVACNTYAEYIKNKNSEITGGADITDSSQSHQRYISRNERKEKWGDTFQTYENKLRAIAQEMCNTVMTYENEPIMAVFFSMCPGKTEDAETVFGQSLPYLKSVTSNGDKLSPDYSNKISYTDEQFKNILSKIDGITLGDEPSDWIGETEKTDVGTVIGINIGNKTISGEEFRNLFDLRSSAFSVSRSESGFSVKTVGYGHFVGMSQYGADYMARQGSDYKEILNHYYTDITISDE